MKIYKAGDRITITKKMVEKMTRLSFIRDADAWLGKTGVVYVKRFDRKRAQICIDWGNNEHTNAHWLEESVGLKFEKPGVVRQSIMEADESILTARELVVRGLVEMSGERRLKSLKMTERAAVEKVEEIDKAMRKYGITFYRP